jgi:choline dehydrogenase-like flavoprotein
MIPPFADSMKVFSTEEVVDVVVIGTGAGAAPVLATLGEAGLSVVALEAGRWWNPAQEYAADEVAMSELYWLQERISAGETPTAFGGNNSGTGVGGSMLHWGAYVPRADPRDLKLRTESGEGVDFPLTYAELVPYYEEVPQLSFAARAVECAGHRDGQGLRGPWAAGDRRADCGGIAELRATGVQGAPGMCRLRVLSPGLRVRGQGQHGCDLPAARGRRRSRDSRKQLCAWL